MPDRILRIPPPAINNLSVPVIESLPSPSVIFPQAPVVNGLKPPIFEYPIEQIPSYDPPVYNPEPEVSIPGLGGSNSEGNSQEEEPARELPPTPPMPEPVLPDPTTGRPVIEAPFIGEIPLPTSSEVALAGTTAVGATAAALLGKSLVEQLLKIMKPVVKKIFLKIKEATGKQFTDYEVQQYFEFEGKVPELKSVAKQLAKDAKVEKATQLEAHLQLQHQRKRLRKESRGGNKPQP